MHRYAQTVGQSISSGGTLDIVTTIDIPTDFDYHYSFMPQYAGNPSLVISNYFRNSNGKLCVTVKNASQSSKTCENVYFKYLVLDSYA